jgi:hypothetical protein
LAANRFGVSYKQIERATMFPAQNKQDNRYVQPDSASLYRWWDCRDSFVSPRGDYDDRTPNHPRRAAVAIRAFDLRLGPSGL